MKIIVADKISVNVIALLRETGWEIALLAAAALAGRNRECRWARGAAARDESDFRDLLERAGETARAWAAREWAR